jgi:hypothetical protein
MPNPAGLLPDPARFTGRRVVGQLALPNSQFNDSLLQLSAFAVDSNHCEFIEEAVV